MLWAGYVLLRIVIWILYLVVQVLSNYRVTTFGYHIVLCLHINGAKVTMCWETWLQSRSMGVNDDYRHCKCEASHGEDKRGTSMSLCKSTQSIHFFLWDGHTNLMQCIPSTLSKSFQSISSLSSVCMYSISRLRTGYCALPDGGDWVLVGGTSS